MSSFAVMAPDVFLECLSIANFLCSFALIPKSFLSPLPAPTGSIIPVAPQCLKAVAVSVSEGVASLEDYVQMRL